MASVAAVGHCRYSIGTKTAILFLCLSTPALPNMGAPMVMMDVPIFAILLLPIVLIEGWVLARALKLKKTKALRVAGYANAFTTFVGIPIAWLVWLLIWWFLLFGMAYQIPFLLSRELSTSEVISMALVSSAWLPPYEKYVGQMIPIAQLVLLAPFFLASFWGELFVCRRMLKEADRQTLRGAVLRGNLYTYAMLPALWLSLSIVTLVAGPG